MDLNIKKIMDMTVSQRFDELNAMSEFNDPKVILRLTNEWEFQSKISTILMLKIKADALYKRGLINFSKECLLQIVNISDGYYETKHRNGNGLKINIENNHPDLNPKKIQVPIWYFEIIEEELENIINAYNKKTEKQKNQLKTLSTPIKISGDNLLQGQSIDWDSKGDFNYFPVNLNKVKFENNIINSTKENIVFEAINSIVKHEDFNKITLNDDEAVLTMGSCFASELYMSLTKHNIKSETLRIEESINTTHANLALIDSIEQGKVSAILKDLLIDKEIEKRLLYLYKIIQQSKIIVLTFGVSPLVINKKSKIPIFKKNLKENFATKEVEMVFTSVKENKENIVNIVKKLRNISPSIEIYITLSPVPLIGVLKEASVLERDVISKSTLRLAIEEARKEIVFKYWPSFEVVKWIPSHLAPNLEYQAFGASDNNSRHVSRWLIDAITQSFIEHTIEII